jgi:hypothetical protein
MDLGGTLEVVRGRRHSGGGEERKEGTMESVKRERRNAEVNQERKEKHWIREAR